MRIFFLISFTVCIIGITACTTTETYAPVMDASQIESVPKSGTYRVSANDTLYSIAWRYGLDYRVLAERNHIAHPYHIEIGQVLYLNSKAPSQISTKTPITTVANQTHSPNTNQNSSTTKNQASLSTTTPSISTSSELLEPTQKVTAWYRPAKGSIIANYSSQNKGLNFSGKLGDPIFATAAGKVVYSGDGLRGYGNLIIIKHNSTFLTAYAHNNKILVKEGEWVQAGQKIAEMGNTGTRHIMLHFEIRRNGKPVNPLNYISYNSK